MRKVKIELRPDTPPEDRCRLIEQHKYPAANPAPRPDVEGAR